MDSLQLGTTIVVPTGTGNLYLPRGGDPTDNVSYQFGSGNTRSVLNLARTLPKPTASFAGVDRFTMKLTRYYVVDEVVVQAVGQIVTSIPVAVASADRIAFRKELILAAHAPALATSPVFIGIEEARLPT